MKYIHRKRRSTAIMVIMVTKGLCW